MGLDEELIKQVKLLNISVNLQIKELNERLERIEKHQRRIDFTNEYVARQLGYKGYIDDDIANSPRKIVRGGFEE